MKHVTRGEILGLAEYEQIRPHFRARVIEAKKARRVKISDIMSATFENRDSVMLQIQEILRAERITAEDGILHEIETYNDLLPGPGQLSLTLFIEISDKEQRESTLTELAGLESSVALEAGGKLLRAAGADRSVEGIARTTAVHYLKLDVPEDVRAAWRSGELDVALVVDHAKRPARAALPPATVRALAADFE